MAEKWRRIAEFPSYKVSDQGRIQHKQKILKGHPTGPAKIVTVSFVSSEGQRKARAVGRVVLEAFVGPPSPGQFTARKDGDPNNNQLENLYWAKRTRKPHTPVTEASVAEVMALLKNGRTRYQVAEELGLTYQAVCYRVRRAMS